MSTTLKVITGRYEAKSHADFTVDYEDSNISITSFYGGKKLGVMLQLSIYNNRDSAYVQLTKEQILDLRNTLLNHLLNK